MNKYKVGDRVRVEIEGEVSYVYSSDYIEVSTPDDTIGLNPTDPAQVITKIVDVPTKPGAVVYPCESDGSHDAYIRMEDGVWANPYGDWVLGSEVERCLMDGTHYVAFEGVES